MSWVKYLVYILSFFIPPVGVITFWVANGRGRELQDTAKWSFLAAFIGFVVWVILAVLGVTMHRMFWYPMGRW
jgi:threonine/homoserine/homoserine lactone efflux protein